MEFEEKIVEASHRLYQARLLFAADGNISLKIDENTILMTPSGVHKGFLKKEQLAMIDLEGKILRGHPSSEMPMHLEIYRSCPKAQAVIHAHPPTAIAWTIARPDLAELPCEAMSEVILAVGSIPIVPFAMPGSVEMGTNLLPYLPKSRVLILARHGGLSWGESMDEAYNGMERLENSAQILKSAYELGGITTLPQNIIEALRKKRLQIGEKSL